MSATQLNRYRWAMDLARVAMGKEKQWGDKPRDRAIEDPLAWWCLTEAIATGGPQCRSLKPRQKKTTHPTAIG